jgi:hypothetical protein
MKTLLSLLLLTVLAPAQEAEERVLLVPWTKVRVRRRCFSPPPREVKARVGLEAVTSEQNLAFRIHQGKAETSRWRSPDRGKSPG